MESAVVGIMLNFVIPIIFCKRAHFRVGMRVARAPHHMELKLYQMSVNSPATYKNGTSCINS